MTFPTAVPGNKTFHLEDTRNFRVKGGRWIRQRDKIILEASGSGVDFVTLGVMAKNRITINSIYKPDGNADLLFNLAAPGWLGMNSWVNGTAQLISGSDSRNNGDWKGLNNPGSGGYTLNWSSGGDWKFQDNMYHTSEINIVDYSTGLLVNWTLMGKSQTNRIWVVRGNVMVSARVHDITHLAFNHNAAGWHIAKHHIELL